MEIEPLEFINSENSRNSTEITFVIDNAQTVLKTLNSLYIFNAKNITLKRQYCLCRAAHGVVVISFVITVSTFSSTLINIHYTHNIVNCAVQTSACSCVLCFKVLSSFITTTSHIDGEENVAVEFASV